MPHILLRYLPHILALVAVVGGLWYFGHTRYNAGQEAVRAEVAEQVAIATAETARIDAERAALAQRIESDLLPKLDAAESNARDIAKRLRIATRRLSLSQDPSGTPNPDGPGGVPADLGSLEESHFAACARDAERLGSWQEFYKQLGTP